MKKREVFLLGTALLALILLASYLYGFTLPKRENLFLTPTIDDARGWEIYTLENEERMPVATSQIIDSSGTIYFEREIPAQWFDEELTRMELATDWWASAFVDGALVYTNYPGVSAMSPVTFPQEGEEIDFRVMLGFSLDPSWAGRTLTMAVDAKEENVSTPRFVLTSNYVFEGQSFAWANGKAMPAMLYAMLGFLLLALFIYSLMQRKANFGLLALAAASLLQMFFFLSHFDDAPFIFLLQPLLSNGFLLLPMLYIALRMQKYKKVFLPLLLICWGVPFVVILMNYFAPTPIFIQNVAPYLMFVPLAAMFPCGILERRNGNRVFRSFITGLYIVFGGVLVLFLLSLPVCALFPEGAGAFAWIHYIFYAIADTMPGLLIYFLNTLLLVLLFSVAALEQIRKSTEAAETVKLLTLKNDLMLENLRALERNGEALAVARHDELHHLRMMAELYREAPEQAAKYADSLAAELSGASPILPVTENRLINTILAVQASRAENLSIRFRAEAILQETLPIADKDLCAVFMNLLENAVNAASNAAPDKEKEVFVKLFVEDGYLFIIIKNTLPRNFDPSILKEKLGKKKQPAANPHGFGLISARTTLARYGGELRFSIEGDVIVLQTAMRLCSL